MDGLRQRLSVLRQRLRPPPHERESARIWMRREWKWLAFTAAVIAVTIAGDVWLATCGLAALMGSAVWASSLIRDPGGNGPRPSIVQSGLDRLAQIRPIDRFISWLSPSPAQGMVPSGWGPPGTFIAGSPAVMGDFAQGEFQPPDPMPRTPPERWLGSETDQTVPL